ncbi:hypothetical protein B0H16DRAFT_687607 [Mycena metata]|uniref:Uncharacterized protein n=1 Tax=Mycena metata TaxID=1033252 RepID=A0AAD7J411_9AGAR|nr:hypothetical protein B0H16DRAFT_687607 [Mycena metata]
MFPLQLLSRTPIYPAMSGSELSLRHLPDLSDASFSFQIPTDSSDDLLRADSTDFFGGPGSLLGSPSRTNDAPLTLSDLTPLPKATAGLYGSTPVQKATKSLLPTTRSNIQDLTVSQIASKVPKPISSHRKRKELVNVADATALETPVTTTKPLSKRSTSSQSPSENLTMTAAGVGTPRVETQPSAIDKLPPIDEKADPSNIPVDEEIVAKPASIPNEASSL